jgi:hypothetical protein
MSDRDYVEPGLPPPRAPTLGELAVGVGLVVLFLLMAAVSVSRH